jgi:phosphatidylglycerol:prolipoprotein diacylglycerol transferase
MGVDLRRAAPCYLLAGVAVLAGSRVLYWLSQPSAPGDRGMEISLFAPRAAGFALYGGVVAAAVVGGLASLALRVDAWSLADAAAVPTGMGIALVRVGCYANGCCYGRPCDLPWAVYPPPGSPAFFSQLADNPARLLTGLTAVHPTPLYELAGAVLAAVTAAVLMRRGAPRGAPALAAALVFTALRWAILPLRDAPRAGEMDSLLYPALYAVLLVLLAVGLWKRVSGLSADGSGWRPAK